MRFYKPGTSGDGNKSTYLHKVHYTLDMEQKWNLQFWRPKKMLLNNDVRAKLKVFWLGNIKRGCYCLLLGQSKSGWVLL